MPEVSLRGCGPLIRRSVAYVRQRHFDVIKTHEVMREEKASGEHGWINRVLCADRVGQLR